MTKLNPGIIAGPHMAVIREDSSEISKLIKKYRLDPVTLGELERYAGPEVNLKKGGKNTPRMAGIFRPRLFPGGIKIPHLHFQGDIYILNDKQWKEISTEVINGLRKKIADAKSVNFG
jgi:hypothetical protein